MKKSPIEDSLSRYLVEIEKYPYLSREEEKKLAMHYFEKQDLESAHKLVSANLKLVVKISYEYLVTGFRVMDLIQEGNIGLLHAVKEFNPYKGLRLSTYASWWIKAYIQNFIIKNWSLVKIGTTQAQRKLFYKLNKEKRELELQGIKPEVKLLSARIGVREDEINEMDGRLAQRDFSLDTPIDGESGKTNYLEREQDRTISQDKKLETDEITQIFKKELVEFEKMLSKKELIILRERLIAEDPLTLQEIGDKLKITRERVRQLENKLKERLKKYILEKIPDLNIDE